MIKKTIKQKTVVGQVLEDIKELIANGTFAVGEKIPTEPELEEMFGIGRSSVREAIKILQYLGILEMYPGRGTFVCENSNLSKEVLSWAILLGRKDFFELIELRRSVELMSVKAFILRHHELGKEWDYIFKEIEDRHRSMQNFENPSTFIENDYEFHGTIIEGSGNSVFIDIYQTLSSFMHEEIKRAFISALPGNLNIIHSEHDAILNAIKSRDIENAQERVETHIEHIINRVEKSFTSRVAYTETT